MQRLLRICNFVIEYSFYALFLLVPLAFTSTTSELFELNKMWVTYGLTIVIAAAWISKMIATESVRIQKTPLDIPIALFLLSQFISTLLSMDTHVSLWGYYSRFNGGFLSILCYVFLYYALVSNISFTEPLQPMQTFGLSKKERKTLRQEQKKVDIPQLFAKPFLYKILLVSVGTGVIVALWGLPSHFGYDPTCLLFRGTLDVSCWTNAFQPKIRIFSTLGQPNWMAAYLAILLPLTISLGIYSVRKINIAKEYVFLSFLYGALAFLFYLDILYTDSRSGLLGLVAATVGFFILVTSPLTKKNWIKLLLFVIGGLLFLLWALASLKENSFIFAGELVAFIAFVILVAYLISHAPKEYKISKFFIAVISVLLLLTTVFSATATTNRLLGLFSSSTQTTQSKQATPKPQITGPALEVGGTQSGKIRFIVWKGALEIWKSSPVFGTGVETYAYAYYKHRPAEHNLTSEWDYLYNKAHNEYLNYLATTGAFGLLSYLGVIGMFLFLSVKMILKSENNVLGDYDQLITIALICSFVSIIVSNFLGFSVVILNIYLFLIPAFFFIQNNQLRPAHAFLFPKNTTVEHPTVLSQSQKFFIIIVSAMSLYMLYTLYEFRQADIAYALGYNYDRAAQYEQANPSLKEAVLRRGSEPTFRDELAFNSAVLAVLRAKEKDATSASSLAQEAMQQSNQTVEEHPNNVVFWKTRVRVFYTLAQLNPNYLTLALEAIKKAADLAPTDAKVLYNLGVLYGQTGNTQKAIEVLEKTIQLKPDYRDAYFALALFYHSVAVDTKNKVVNRSAQQKAITSLQYIFDHIAKQDTESQKLLESWKTQ